MTPSLIWPILLSQVPPKAALKHPWHRQSLLPSRKGSLSRPQGPEFLFVSFSGHSQASNGCLFLLLLLSHKHTSPGQRLLLNLLFLLSGLHQADGMRHHLLNPCPQLQPLTPNADQCLEWPTQRSCWDAVVASKPDSSFPLRKTCLSNFFSSLRNKNSSFLVAPARKPGVILCFCCCLISFFEFYSESSGSNL